MTQGWDGAEAGVLCLPSGRQIRGRALRRPLPMGVVPDFGVYLLGGDLFGRFIGGPFGDNRLSPPGRRPGKSASEPWSSRIVRWPDFGLPKDRVDAREALVCAWQRCATERVEIACPGGRGRTGTALACLAVLDGVSADRAVSFVRERYDARAVETPWQRRYVRDFVAG